MYDLQTNPLFLSGSVINPLRRQVLIVADEGYPVCDYPPDFSLRQPQVSWIEHDKTAGVEMTCQLNERPLRLEPGFTKIGRFNDAVLLVLPTVRQRENIKQFWLRSVRFQQAHVVDAIDAKGLQRRSGCYAGLIASSGPATASHYLPGQKHPLPKHDLAPAYVLSGSGAALVAYYSVQSELDYLLIPAIAPLSDTASSHTDAQDSGANTADTNTEINALIPARLLVDPDAVLRQCDPSQRRHEYEPHGSV